MSLTEAQEKEIRDFVESQHMKVETLRDDIIDHLCSEVESRLKAGVHFQLAFSDAVKELAPNGLKDIDEQTVYLPNNNFIRMKKFTYLIGFLGSIFFVLGLAAMGYDRSIASIIFLSGIIFLVLFLPFYAIDKYHAGERSKIEIIKLTFGSLAGVFYGTGVFLKLAGFSSGGLISLSLIPLLLFIPFLFLSMYKKSISS